MARVTNLTLYGHLLTPWSPSSAELYKKEGYGEGRGDRAVLDQFGIIRPPDTKAKHDIRPDELRFIVPGIVPCGMGGEIKCLETKSGSLGSAFRLGASSEMMGHYHGLHNRIIEWEWEARHGSRYLPFIDKRVLDASNGGIWTPEIIELLPEPLLAEARLLWAPETVMNYALLILTASSGFIPVQRHEFSQAFLSPRTSQSRLSYTINWNYFMNRDTITT